MFLIYRFRRMLATLPALSVVIIAIIASLRPGLAITTKVDDSVVEVTLTDIPDVPPPEPEVTPPEPPPPPEVEEPEPEPVIEQPKPKPKPKPQPPKPQPKPQVQPPEPVKQPPKAEAPPKPQTPPPSNAALIASQEARYVAQMRTELEKYKQYPTGREASLQRPQGSVVIWLEVDRSGKVLDSGIEQKAASMLLNRAAAQSLRRIEQVPPFPAEAFAGREHFRFTATFVYTTEG